LKSCNLSEKQKRKATVVLVSVT